jgi:Sortilin, neurotensin receptor 3,
MKFFGLYICILSTSIFICSNIKIVKTSSYNYCDSKPDEMYWQSKYYSTDQSNPELLQDAYEKLLKSLRIKNMRGANNWQIEGPYNIGGRVNTIAIKPNNTDIMLIGTPHGGMYRTTDGGSNWSPVFDNFTTQNISVIVFDVNNPNTVFVGTGDAPLAGDARVGNGVYKSIDAGLTWAYFGLKQVQTITKIVVDPADANHLYISGMGNPFTKDKNRGVYETKNNGTTWNQILFVDSTVGIADMIINPQNAKTIYATSRHRSRSDKFSIVSGPKTKIFKSINGGISWDTLYNGLPTGNQTRIGLAISMQDTNKVYANYVNAIDGSNFGGIWRTLNGGATWSARYIGSNVAMNGFGWYFGEIRVNPNNDEMVYILSVDLWRSTNGGQTFSLNAPIMCMQISMICNLLVPILICWQRMVASMKPKMMAIYGMQKTNCQLLNFIK